MKKEDILKSERQQLGFWQRLPRGQNKKYSLRTIIAEAAFFLKQSGIEQPYKTAELILAYVLNEPVVNLF